MTELIELDKKTIVQIDGIKCILDNFINPFDDDKIYAEFKKVRVI